MKIKFRISVLRYILLVIASIVIALPLVWAICAGLRPLNESFAAGNVFFGSYISFSSYKKVLSLVPFGQYLINSCIQVCLILIMQLITSSLAAYAFSRWNFMGKNILFTIILLQMMIPFAALLVGNFKVVSTLGLYNTIPGIAIPFFGSAFGTFLLRQNFLSLPIDFSDAAEIDGCRWDQILRFVYLPNSGGSVAAFSLSSISWHWNDFLWPLVITQSEKVRPVTIGLARFTQMGEIGAQWSLLAAATIIVIVPLLVLFLVLREHFFESYLSVGIK